MVSDQRITDSAQPNRAQPTIQAEFLADHRGTGPGQPEEPKSVGPSPKNACEGTGPDVLPALLKNLHSPCRNDIDREMLELVGDVRNDMRHHSQDVSRGPSPADLAALTASRGSPLAGLEFKQSLPVIRDSDLDLEKHLREFRGIVDCYALTGNQGIRAYDLLVVFKKTLVAGSTRLKIYDSEVNKAVKAG